MVKLKIALIVAVLIGLAGLFSCTDTGKDGKKADASNVAAASQHRANKNLKERTPTKTRAKKAHRTLWPRKLKSPPRCKPPDSS